ncbi:MULTISPECIES: type II toxin-antitoxin system RelE/ParE family toxin [unclassified Paraburkholderia]|uniref:type II toxin-antitoxin system RelE/ParE family toxin n=1 Tax=unclassified Paraburkholderia TaxID=2615204 RepID=UPI002AB1126A|nr:MULTISPECIES: type II toxin-antitoxin system RelE/ParE family toxin [unclassified Paraburkholderia]
MSTVKGDWHIALADLAQQDFRNILRWTAEKFGQTQTRDYALTISTTLQDLSFGPDMPGVRQRNEIGPGIMTLHVARNRRRGRHFVVFRVSEKEKQRIDVLRILHEAMDLPAHV